MLNESKLNKLNRKLLVKLSLKLKKDGKRNVKEQRYRETKAQNNMSVTVLGHEKIANQKIKKQFFSKIGSIL